MSHTVLQVPVPQLEPFVRARTEHYDPAWLSPDPGFVHAHITALAPFLPPERLDVDALAVVAQIAESTAAFDIDLSVIDTFPNGIIHLVPQPLTPFRLLTQRLWEAFPDCPPYAGQFPDVRPHLTLDARSEPVTETVNQAVTETVTEDSTRVLLGDLLPVQCRAERLDLAWYEAQNCRILQTWRLGG